MSRDHVYNGHCCGVWCGLEVTIDINTSFQGTPKIYQSHPNQLSLMLTHNTYFTLYLICLCPWKFFRTPELCCLKVEILFVLQWPLFRNVFAPRLYMALDYFRDVDDDDGDYDDDDDNDDDDGYDDRDDD